MTMRLHYTVEMDDGTTHAVTVDQRDWARMEAQEFSESALLTKTRYLAHSAMTRQGTTKLAWPEFNDRLCVDVSLTEDEADGEGEQSPNPGHQAAQGGTR